MKRLDKPYGYCPYVLALDCETSGIFRNTEDHSYNPETKAHCQIVSIGLIVASTETLKPVDQLYVEIKWNGKSSWQREAENVHGLSKEYLDANGITEKQAVEKIGNFILQYWDPSQEEVRTLGYNVVAFDLPFIRRLFRKFNIEFNFGYRHYDVNSMGFATFGSFTSNDLFYKMGFEKRDKHNALEDAKMALKAARQIRLLWKKFITER